MTDTVRRCGQCPPHWNWAPPPSIVTPATRPTFMELVGRSERCALCGGPISTVERVWCVWIAGVAALACDPCGTAAPGPEGTS